MMKGNDGDYGYEMVEYGNGLAVQQRSPGVRVLQWCVPLLHQTHIYLLRLPTWDVEYGMGPSSAAA